MSGPTRAQGGALTEQNGRSWKVLIADDEPLARARLRALLARHPEFELTAECGSGAAVLAALRDQVQRSVHETRARPQTGLATLIRPHRLHRRVIQADA